MSTTDHTPSSGRGSVELIHNEEDGTVTFAPAPRDEIALPATEWITVDAEDLADVRDWQ